MHELKSSSRIIEIARENSRDTRKKEIQIDIRRDIKNSQNAKISCSKDNTEPCCGIKIAITRVARVRIRTKIRSPEGERSEFMAGGSAGRETHTACIAGLGFAKYVATGRESVPNRRQSTDRRPKFSNPGSAGLGRASDPECCQK